MRHGGRARTTDEDKLPLNNNRNNRRRGRGNRTNQGGGGNQLNRIDSRARGNAPQLLDKFKKLAQDAQHNGDRVQAEYYLQFADHYFRVIADNKARQDEARAKRNDGRDQANDDSDDGEDGESRRNENNRGGEGRSDNRNDSGRGENRRGGNRRPRGRRDDQNEDGQDRIAPEEGVIGVEGEVASVEEDAPKPKRRARKPKAELSDDEPRRKPRASRAKPKRDDGDDGEIDSSVLPPAIGTEDRDSDDSLEAVG